MADVRSRVLSYTSRSWLGLSQYRDSDAERLIALLVPRIEAGQKKIAELTDAYLSRVAADQLGATIKRGTVALATTLDLRGVPADEVYQRPFTTVYTSLSTGSTLTAAISAGAARMADLASTGMQLAKTHSAQKAMSRSGVQLFQRVLSGKENCPLCVIASTQRYHSANLMPIHPGCDCHEKSFVGNPDVQVIEPQLLEETHSLLESKFGGTDRGARDLGLGKFDQSGLSDLTDLVVTNEHGEIGPVLGFRGGHFTGPNDLN